MQILLKAAILPALLVSCGDLPQSEPEKKTVMADKPVRIQFAFMRFNGVDVRLAVDGKTVLDRKMTVAKENMRSGLADFAQIEMPTCARITITAGDQNLAQSICLAPTTKSITVDGGPPLTLVQQDYLQGVD